MGRLSIATAVEKFGCTIPFKHSMFPSFTLIGRHASIFEKGKILSNDYSLDDLSRAQIEVTHGGGRSGNADASEVLIHASTCS